MTAKDHKETISTVKGYGNVAFYLFAKKTRSKVRKLKEVLSMSIDELVVNALEQAATDLEALEPGTEEYKRQCEAIAKLNEIVREREKAADESDEKNSPEVKKERLKDRLWQYALPAGVNLLGIILVLHYESAGNFITSKAFGMVQKVRGLFG